MNNELLVQKINQVIVLEEKLRLLKEVEEQIKQEKEDLRQSMISAELKKWETPNGTKITLVEDGADEEIEVPTTDVEKFIEENSKLVDEYNNVMLEYQNKKKEYTTYTKEIKKGRKGYVKITLPKSE